MSEVFFLRRRLVGLATVPLLLLSAAACGEDDPAGSFDEAGSVDMGEEISGVEVTGEVGEEPQVDIDAPLKLDETTTQVITAGDGDEAAVGEEALLHLYLANATTGKKALSSYDQDQPVALELSDDQLFPSLVEAIAGKPVGSRVAVAAVPDDAFGPGGGEQLGLAQDPVLFVVDLISAKPTDVLDGPSGVEADDDPDLPTIEESDGKITGLSFDEAPAEPAAGLETTTLVEGEGEPIRDGSLVTMNYLGQVYGSEKPFDNSFVTEPATFGVGAGQLISGWDSALVGIKAGSRVMLSVPPDEGYGAAGNPDINVTGDDTLVFLIDVLGVG